MPFGDDSWDSVARQGKSWRAKPPKKGCGGKKKMFGALLGALAILGSLTNAIAQSFIG